MVEIIGWIGSVCFAACAIPQAWQCMRQGDARGISLAFLLLWLCGEVLYYTAFILQFGLILWVVFNFIANVICITIILLYYRKGH